MSKDYWSKPPPASSCLVAVVLVAGDNFVPGTGITYIAPSNAAFFMDNPIRITLARKKTELKQIIELQKKNHLETVSEDTAKDQGFVTAVHTYEVLEAMNSAAASVIAKDGTKVVGYALTMKREFANEVPALTELFERQDNAIHHGQRLGDQNYLVMGQTCVAEEVRGQRVVDRMYKYMRSCYSLHYPYLVTAIDARNARSIRVHERIGFKLLDRFIGEESGKDWMLVIWDWERK